MKQKNILMESKDLPFIFQTLKNKAFNYSDLELKIIGQLKPFVGGEWGGKIKVSCCVQRKVRDKLVFDLKNKLLSIQGNYCIYCGIHEDYSGGYLQREHIVPKGKKSYPIFMFEPQNLVLACEKCNEHYKKVYNPIQDFHNEYCKCSFKIVHPYLDNVFDHIEFTSEKNQIVIMCKDNSSKGLEYIKLFGLDDVKRTLFRSALFKQYEIFLADDYDELIDNVLKNKYFK